MRNGYALCHQTELEAISAHLAKLGLDDLDALRARPSNSRDCLAALHQQNSGKALPGESAKAQELDGHEQRRSQLDHELHLGHR
jgi:hypothetical protein